MKMYKFNSKVFLYFLVIMSFNLTVGLFAESKSIREKRPGGIFLQLGGPIVLGLDFDYHLSNLFDLDFGFGINADIQAGLRYQPLGEQTDFSLFPYIGFYVERINKFNLFGSNDESGTAGVYIPLGLEWYAYEGLTISFEIGYNNAKKDFGQLNTKNVNGAFRIGYHIWL